VKNRMPEIGASGTVRGGDGNILTYSATPARDAGPLTERATRASACRPAFETRHRFGLLRRNIIRGRVIQNITL
jgi:hypothetical protein